MECPDHDILLRLDERVKTIERDVLGLQSLHVPSERDHIELLTRVRSIEDWRTSINARIIVFTGIGVLGGSVIGALTAHLLGG